MPATEQTWRNQKTLHIIFAVTGVLMLLATLLMFAADHSREWKDYQRTARNIENRLTQWRLNEVGSAENERARLEIEQQLELASAEAIDRQLLQQFQQAVARDAQARGEAQAQGSEEPANSEGAAKEQEERQKLREAYNQAHQTVIEHRQHLASALTAGSEPADVEALQEALDVAEAAQATAHDNWIKAVKEWDELTAAQAEAGMQATEDRQAATAAREAYEAAREAVNAAQEQISAAQSEGRAPEEVEALQAELRRAEIARELNQEAWTNDQELAEASTQLAAQLRDQVLEGLQSQLNAARLRENNLTTARKFKAADYDAARATLGLHVRDNRTDLIDGAQAEIDRIKQELDQLTLQREAATTYRQTLQDLLAQMTARQSELQKQLTDNLAERDRLVSLLSERKSTYFTSTGLPGKKWLELPILDAFNSPLKIDNNWTAGLTQPVGSFGQVRRFDRCTTCHQGIDKTLPGSAVEPAYEEQRTIHLTLTSPEEAPPAELDEDGNPRPLTLESVYGFSIAPEGLIHISDATVDFVRGESLSTRAAIDPADAEHAESGLRVGDVIAFVNNDKVTYPEQVREMLLNGITWGQTFRLTVERGLPQPYASHPRLDLFVGSLSPHQLSVMACTVCHEGQGSATEFKFASHTPNDPQQARDWSREHGWFNNHHWIYPMYPARFAESACLKCHHTVEELAPSERFPEPPAPKLMAGYELIERYGCFGCHEINGFSSPEETIGPDMRLEPNYYAAALALKADPGFEQLDEQQQQRIRYLAEHPEADQMRQELRDMLLSDAQAEEPVLTRDSHLLEEVLKDVEMPGRLRKTGPSLRYVASKLGEPFLYDWIEKPSRFRPDTRMPQFFGHLNHLHADLQQQARQAVQEIAASPEIESLPGAAAIRQQAQALAEQAGHDLPNDERMALRQLLLQNRDAILQQSSSDAAGGEATVNQLERWADALADASEVFEPVEVLGIVRYLLAKSQPFQYIEPVSGYGSGDAEQIERGKLAFELRGCLSCHSHADFPRATADKGPDLTHIGDKLSSQSGAPDGQAWLYSWVSLPSHYSARSIMPDLFLDPETDADGNVHDPAADITAYLMASSQNWAPVTQPEIPIRDLDQFVLENLRQPFPARQAAQYLKEGIPVELADSLKGAELELVGEMTDEKKLLYVGRKAIGKYGCYGCHDIPGFENAKPIGTGLADWGRKETSQLAFEHILEYLHGHAHGTGHGSVTAHAGPSDGSGTAEGGDAMEETADGESDQHASADHAEGADGSADPFDDSYYMDQLSQHSRTGFIWQKLKEPRSYDFKKTQNKRYDERLRMPQFPFTDQEREAVITFVLGLVAEPPAKQFTYVPDQRQRAIVEGREVLRRFNCGGCHILETEKWYLEFDPGALETQSEVVDFPFLRPHLSQEQLEQSQETDRLRGTLTATLRGLPVVSDETGQVVVWDQDYEVLEPEDLEEMEPSELYYPMNLWEPVAIEGSTYEVGVSPLAVPGNAVKKRIATVGGDLTWWLLPRVVEIERETNPAAKGGEAFGWLPPPLVDQGNKVQPDWLHDFLLDPHPIRPAVFLRMPKFNMSSEDATKLVNYFAARDNANYPFEYNERTRPQHLELADRRLATASAGTASSATASSATASSEAGSSEAASSGSGEGEVGSAASGHLGHAMQIVTSSDYCIKCHLVGDFVPAGSPRALAPNLADVQSRIRPDYMRRWIANPKKILPYTSMPVNVAFNPDDPHLGGVAQTLYPGTSIQQVDALVDLLVNYDEFLARQTDITRMVQEAAAQSGSATAATGGAGPAVPDAGSAGVGATQGEAQDSPSQPAETDAATRLP